MASGRSWWKWQEVSPQWNLQGFPFAAAGIVLFHAMKKFSTLSGEIVNLMRDESTTKSPGPQSALKDVLPLLCVHLHLSEYYFQDSLHIHAWWLKASVVALREAGQRHRMALSITSLNVLNAGNRADRPGAISAVFFHCPASLAQTVALGNLEAQAQEFVQTNEVRPSEDWAELLKSRKVNYQGEVLVKAEALT